MPIDLTATAAENSHRRRDEAAALVANDATGSLRTFWESMKETSMGSTVHAAKVVSYDESSEIVCTRQAMIKELGRALDPDEIEEMFHSRQISHDGFDWYPARMAFESHWHHGTELVYWSLLTDGPGLATVPGQRYGPYCLVIKDPQTPPPLALAVFPGNTAELYGTGGVLNPQCEDDATAWEDRGDMLTGKHALGAASTPQHDWAALICSPDDFSEVVRAGDLPISAIGEVRMTHADFAELRRQRAQTIMSDATTTTAVPASAVRDANIYEILRSWRRRFGLRIVVT